MDIASLRLYLPALQRWRPLIVLVVLLVGLALLVLGVTIDAAAGVNPPADELLGPFRWGPDPAKHLA